MEKFEFLFKSYKGLYIEGSPLIICARALIKNNENGKIFVQLKFKNISYKIIKAVKVLVKAFDSFGNEVEGKEYQYIDISVKRNEEFGNKQLIELLNNTTRSFSVICKEVLFEEGKSDLLDENTEWKEIIEQKELEEKFGKDIAEQYRRDTFSEAKYEPDYFADIWRCTCGAINKKDENKCNVCRNNINELLKALERETLAENLKKYKKAQAEKIEAERIAAEKKAEADRIAAETQKKKTVKTLKIVLPVLAAIIVAVVVFTTVIQPMMNYNAAVALMESGKYEEAITAFEAMGDYKDSTEQIANCENGIIEQNYQSAVVLMKEEKYEEAAKIFNSIKKYKDSDNLSKESSYLRANKLVEEKKYNEALPILKNLGNYKDSKEIEEEIDIFAKIETLKKANVGDVAPLGENLYKSVNWRILAKDGDRILLITEECIASRMYNDIEKEVTWETCTLRKWLNDDFINSTFSDKEKVLITTTNVTNEAEYGKVGKDTKDKIFLLSEKEANEYFESDKSRVTGWAHNVGSLTLDGNVPAWWLRTPGVWGNDTVSVVEYDGSINMLGDYVTSNDAYGYNYVGGVRPAMWIDLSLAE